MIGFQPSVIEQGPQGERVYDLYSRLLKDRLIFVSGFIDDDKAELIVAQLLMLDAQSSANDIFLYINSSGSSLTAAMAIYDTIQYVNSDVSTVCIGQAYGISALLLASGSPSKRMALANARILIHQSNGSFQGQASDIKIHAKELLTSNKRVLSLFEKHSQLHKSPFFGDGFRDRFLSPIEAVDLGLIDKAITANR